MTIPSFGRVTPMQMTMLRLVGYRLSRAEATLAIPDDERLHRIVLARKSLVNTTHSDYEYELSDWHNFLVAHEEYGYTHPYAFTGVKKAVLQANVDQQRAALLARIRSIEKPAVAIPKFGLVTPSQRAMLGLIGYRLSPTEAALTISDGERTENIVRARNHLCELTGEDFGYEVAAWQKFLLTHEMFNYTYPYAFSLVEQAIHSNKRDKRKRDGLLSRISS